MRKVTCEVFLSTMTGYALFGQLPGAHLWLNGEVSFPCLPRSSTPVLLKRLHIVPPTRHEQQPYASVRFAKRPQVGEFYGRRRRVLRCRRKKRMRTASTNS